MLAFSPLSLNPSLELTSATIILQAGEKLIEWNKDVSTLNKRSEVEATLSELVKQKWINESRDGKLTLGVRSFAELQDWIHRLIDDENTSSCICDEVVVQGVRCSKCNKKLHFHCVVQIANACRDGAEPKCPFCREPGTLCLPVSVESRVEANRARRAQAETAAAEVEDASADQQQTGGRGASGRRVRSPAAAEAAGAGGGRSSKRARGAA